jgi:hypothetical protein
MGLHVAAAWGTEMSFRLLEVFFELWRSGELKYELQLAMLRSSLDKFIEARQEELKALRADPLTPLTQIIAASEEYLKAGDMWVEFANATDAATEKKNAAFDPAWANMAGFGHGWITPHRNGDGSQTIEIACCACGSAHWHDFRIQSGLVEFRTFAKKENGHDRDGKTPAPGRNGHGAAEACA